MNPDRNSDPDPDSAPAPYHGIILRLAARLPLSTGLRADLLSMLCPLRRLQCCVDALRLLLDPQRTRAKTFKYRLVVSHAARDSICGTGMEAQPAPRVVVAHAPLPITPWTSSDSMPHG